MQAGTSRVHADAAAELIEWWEDVTQRGTGSQVLLLPAPPGWGATTLLARFAGSVGEPPVARVLAVSGGDAAVHATAGAQVAWLHEQVVRASLVPVHPVRDQARRLLGVDRGEGMVDRPLGVAGLFAATLAAQVAGLLVSLGLGALSVLRDDSPHRPANLVRQLAGRVAHEATGTPVLVLVDEADLVDADLAVALVRGLVEPLQAQVLVVVVVDPLRSALTDRLQRLADEKVLAGRVHPLDVDTRVGYPQRQGLVDEVLPDWPEAARTRLATDARHFGDVFRVLALDGAARVPVVGDGAAQLRLVGELLAAADPDGGASAAGWPARVVAWAGGLLHRDQLAAVLEAVGSSDDLGPSVTALGEGVRLTHPGRLDRLAAVTTGVLDHHDADPRGVVTSLASQVVAATADPLAHVAALRPVHHLATRPHNAYRVGEAALLVRLARTLADLGDDVEAYSIAEVTREAAYETDDEASLDAAHAVLLELSQRRPEARGQGRVLADRIHANLGATTTGLETRVWATIVRLGDDATRAEAVGDAELLAVLLDRLDSPTADWWRLLLAFHVGNAGHPEIAHPLLAPLLADDTDADTRQLAEWVLYAVGGPNADQRLYLTALENAPPPPDASPQDHLRHTLALAATHAALHHHDQAAHHAERAVTLLTDLVGPDHPQTLVSRNRHASWVGAAGHPEKARRLCTELLPDSVRVFGPDQPVTLNARNELARWTGATGQYEEARRLYADLVPTTIRTLGPDHPDTLTTRNNLASMTGEAGEPEKARQLMAELLPESIRILGPDHPDTLNTLNNLAKWTGMTGQYEEARRLYAELLPSTIRTLGPDHPTTLGVRNSLAGWSGDAGRPEEARRLFEQVLPDRSRILGPDHPDTLSTRSNLASWTGLAGQPEKARQLFADLLADRVRVLGADHPDVANTRRALAYWTEKTRE